MPSGFLVGLAGFEPAGCRSQSPVPYRLATAQQGYIEKRPKPFSFKVGWIVGFEPTAFRATI